MSLPKSDVHAALLLQHHLHLVHRAHLLRKRLVAAASRRVPRYTVSSAIWLLKKPHGPLQVG